MKKLLLAGILAVSLSQPALAKPKFLSKLGSGLKKVGFVTKKALVCPVYIGGGTLIGAVVGGATGSVLWYHVGGHAGDFHRAVTGNDD